MADLPTGTVTFLFTDIEGSTERWERDRVAMAAAVQRHLALLDAVIHANGGVHFKTVGDAVQAAFPTAPQAVAAVLEAQRALLAYEWGEIGGLRVRMALHSGEATPDVRGDYLSAPLNRLSRLLATGHGGQILLSQTVQQLSRGALPAGTELKDLGAHRLRDLLDPERVFQLTHPDLADDFPPLRSLDARPHNLPLQPTPFLGREREVAEVVALLQRPDVRLLTLTGPGGTGKSRLALQAAAELLDDFADGVYFVPLAAIADPDRVPSAIAGTMGIREEGQQPLSERIQDVLGTRQVLLVLDNFEHLVDAAAASGAILSAAPGLKVLVTSRVPLRLRAEREYPVTPLSLPRRKPPPTLEQLTKFEAVRLFIDRAQAVKPDFTIENESAPAVAEVCWRLDGLPLAIELAAARVRMLPPQAILTRLEQCLPFLTGGARDAPTRQRTLRDTISWSYDLLEPDDQIQFRRLAVFAGGWTLEAAEAVVNPDGQRDAFGAMERLLEHCLLRQEAGASGEPRFAMLETIREYGLERLIESGEAEESRTRHAEHFAVLAERADEEGRGPEGTAWIERCLIELPNIRAALGWATTRDGGSALGLRIASALRLFWTFRGRAEGCDWLERLLRQDAEAPATIRAKAMLTHGYLLAFAADVAHAERSLRESEELYSALQDTLGLTHVTYARGILAVRQGDPDGAEPLLKQALADFSRRGMTAWEATSLFWLSNVAIRRNELTRARALLEEALSLQERTGWGSGKAIILGNLAWVASLQGDHDRAEEIAREALLLGRESSDLLRMFETLVELAWIAAERGDGQRAARLGGVAQAIGQLIGFDLSTSDHPKLFTTVKNLLGDDFETAWGSGAVPNPGGGNCRGSELEHVRDRFLSLQQDADCVVMPGA